MAVEDLKSSAITNADATPLVLTNARIMAGAMREAIGTKQASASASIGSTYRLCRVPSNARISQVIASCDAFDTTGAADIGIYQTAENGSAVVDADFFASALLMTTALPNTVCTHESGVFGIEDVEKPLWEALGLSADSMRDYDVVMTLTAANGAGATPDVTLRVQYAI